MCNDFLANSISLASLVIARHPFPKTVFKEKKLSEPVEVRLLTGAKVMVRPKTKVKAFLVSEESSVRPLVHFLFKGYWSATVAIDYGEKNIFIFASLIFRHRQRERRRMQLPSSTMSKT